MHKEPHRGVAVAVTATGAAYVRGRDAAAAAAAADAFAARRDATGAAAATPCAQHALGGAGTRTKRHAVHATQEAADSRLACQPLPPAMVARLQLDVLPFAQVRCAGVPASRGKHAQVRHGRCWVHTIGQRCAWAQETKVHRRRKPVEVGNGVGLHLSSQNNRVLAAWRQRRSTGASAA